MSIKKLQGSSVTNFTLEDFSVRGGFNIIAGPNIDVLFDACKYVQSDDIRKAAAHFEIIRSRMVDKPGINLDLAKVPVRGWRIFAIQQVAGSPHLLNLTGECEVELNFDDGRTKENYVYQLKSFQTQYNLEQHTGIIVFHGHGYTGSGETEQATFCDLSQDTYD